MAGYLSEKIIKVGPPLVLKRDNGGNVNNGTANEVLSEFFVLHLNSPEYYAPYNGAIEEAQRELKACLREKLISDIPRCQDLIALYAEVTAHALNHRLRPCLNGRLAARRFFLWGRNRLFRNVRNFLKVHFLRIKSAPLGAQKF